MGRTDTFLAHSDGHATDSIFIPGEEAHALNSSEKVARS